MAWQPDKVAVAREAFPEATQLETGELVAGGCFVEDAEGRFLSMDTENLDRSGLFERVNATLLRFVVPPGAVEIEFLLDADGLHGLESDGFFDRLAL